MTIAHDTIVAAVIVALLAAQAAASGGVFMRLGRALQKLEDHARRIAHLEGKDNA